MPARTFTPPASKQSSAFTLVELLVVIAIIGILASILIPVVGNIMESARSQQCVNRLRQIGVANQLYMADNDKQMVPAFGFNVRPGEENMVWQDRLIPYLPGTRARDRVDPKSVFNCPEREVPSEDGPWWNQGVSYALNSFQRDPQWEWRYVRIPNPSNIIHVLDIEVRTTEWAQTSDGFRGGAPIEFRHHGLANVLFCDGHVESLSSEELMLNPPSGQSRWRWWD